MKVHRIGGHGFGSNIYLILDEVITLIDAGTGRNFKQAQSELQSHNIELSDIDLLINTHCHYDHTGGDSKFIGASNCELAAHELAAKPLEAGDSTLTLAEFFGEELEPLKISRILVDGDEIKLGDSTLEVLHTPGHTQGGISLYDSKDRILFSGDTVFKGGIGRLDLPGSDSSAMIKSLQKLSQIDVDKLYPGHGPIAAEDGGKYVKIGLDLLG